MSEPFLAEIRMFGFSFAPKGWAFCNGQLMPIAQNTALYSLLGPTFGGDGKTTFGLPNLQGSVPMHPGNGNGLTPRILGEAGGSNSVELTNAQIPAHTHSLGAQTVLASGTNSGTNAVFNRPANGNLYDKTAPQKVAMAPQAIVPAGSSLPHNNMMPYLAVNFCIALEGVYPIRP